MSEFTKNLCTLFPALMPANVRNDRLLRLLYEKLNSPTFEHVFALLAPFYERLRSGEYPLKSQQELNCEQIKSALASATGEYVPEITFLRCTRPSSKPDWMTQSYLAAPIGDILHARFNDLIYERLGSERINPLYDSVTWHFGNQLKACLKVSVAEEFIPVIFKEHWSSYLLKTIPHTCVLFYYLALVLSGDHMISIKLEPLVLTFLECIPLARIKDDQESWIVLSG